MSELDGTNGTKTAPTSGTPHKCEAFALGKEQSYLLYDQDHEPAPPAASLEKTNDPVRMYLREMGTGPLLTRQGEVEIAKRIEKGQKSVIKALSRSPVVVGEISKYGEKLRKNGLNIKHLVQVNDEELADEILEKRRKAVLKRIDEIAALEAKAAKVRKQLAKSKKDSKKYKRLLSQLARYRIPMARIICNLQLTSQIHQELVNVMKRKVECIVTLERESKKLKKLQESPLKLDEKKKVKLRLWVIDKEMKEIEDKVLASPAGLKRTLAAIKQGELEAEIAKKELVEANLRLVVSIAKKYTNRRGSLVHETNPFRTRRHPGGGQCVSPKTRAKETAKPIGIHQNLRTPGTTPVNLGAQGRKSGFLG